MARGIGFPSFRSVAWGIGIAIVAIFLVNQFPALQNLTRPR